MEGYAFITPAVKFSAPDVGRVISDDQGGNSLVNFFCTAPHGIFEASLYILGKATAGEHSNTF